MAKKIIKFFWNSIKILTGAAFVLATFYYSYLYLSKVFVNKEVDYGDSFHNMPKNSVDIVVLGSSHVQYSFIPSFAYQDSGLYSYVLGSACQPLKVSYEMLKETLKTQNPELVILEVYTATPLKSMCEGDVCYVSAQYQMRGEEKQNVINFLPEEKAEAYRNDFVNNHNTWRTMDGFKDLILKQDTTISPYFGYIEIDAALPPLNSWYPLIYNNLPDYTLDREDVEALDNILDLCNKENIQLLLYMVPMDGLTAENQAALNKVWEWADKNEIKYIDFIQLSRKLDYQLRVHNDGAHSYSNGASFITDYLMNYVKENYVFHKHENNQELNKLYSLYIPGLTSYVLSTEYNPIKYLTRLVNYPDTFVIMYDYYNYPLRTELKEALLKMNLEGFDGNDRYYAIVKGGKTLYYSNKAFEYDLDDYHFKVGNGALVHNEETINTGYGLNLTVFYEGLDNYVNKSINTEYNWDNGYTYSYQPWN